MVGKRHTVATAARERGSSGVAKAAIPMAEQRSRFVGIYEHGIDDKGRMVLPSRVRGQLGETGMLGMLDGCLGLWTLDGFDTVADELDARVASGEAPMNAFRTFMAYAAEI